MFPPRGSPPRLSALAVAVLLGLLGALASPVAAQTPPLSTVATLSGLELSEGRLDPHFASGTTDYAAAVGYTVTRITVSPTKNDANATLEFLDGSDNPLADADGSTDGLQVDLTVGVTTIKVEVTAEDGLTVNTYILTVTRTAEDTSLSPPASDPAAAFPSTAVYDVEFQGRWITAVTPGGLPSGAHFSRLIGGVHSDAVTFLESGGTASAGVESMAEVGDGRPCGARCRTPWRARSACWPATRTPSARPSRRPSQRPSPRSTPGSRWSPWSRRAPTGSSASPD